MCVCEKYKNNCHSHYRRILPALSCLMESPKAVIHCRMPTQSGLASCLASPTSMRSTTAYTPSEHVSSSFRCHVAQLD